MKPEDIQFVRERYRIALSYVNGIDQHPAVVKGYKDELRLLSLLIEAEAMREKAEFERDHPISATSGWCYGCVKNVCIDERRRWSDADWIAAKKREWGI